MIRTVVVIIALVIGWSFAIQSPLFAAAFYLWIAYFRPESWAWSDVFTTLNLSYFAGAFLLKGLGAVLHVLLAIVCIAVWLRHVITPRLAAMAA